MLARFLRVLLALLPLAVGLYLLRLMPLAVLGVRDVAGQTPATTFRIDPLVLSGFVLLPLAAALPQPSIARATRLAVGVALAGLALAATDRALQLLLFYAVTLALAGGLGLRWFAALGALSAADLLPRAVALGWLDAQHSRSLVLPLLILAALAGLGCLPWSASRGGASESELLLRPLWLFPLLKTFSVAPWPPPWPLVVPLLGAAATIWATLEALRTRDTPSVFERVLAAMLGMALICAGMSSAVGIVAALWVLLAHALLVLWTGAGRRAGSSLAAFLLLFLAAWWTVAAAAGGAAFLIAAGAWLAGMAGGVAVLLPAQPSVAGKGRPSGLGAVLIGAALALLIALFMPVTTRFVAVPVADQLDPGLAPYGLLDYWPWIGVAALDPGHRRAALLPTAVLAPLFAVTLAITWLVLRLVAHWMARPDGQVTAAEPVEVSILGRVWWVGRRRG